MATKKIPLPEQMFEAGVHFGHLTRKWHPNIKPYIFDDRDNVHIIDLQKTYEQLQEATNIFEEQIEPTTNIVVVGTKKQAAPLVKKFSEKANLFYVNNRWPGGLITNFRNVRKAVDRYEELVQLLNNESEVVKLSTKKQFDFMKERDKLEKVFGGLSGMESAPNMLLVIDPRREKTAIHEAKLSNVFTIGIVDTNTDPKSVDHPIPANDDALKSIELILGTLTEEIRRVKESKKQKQETA